MNYKQPDITYFCSPKDWDKNSGKEILQYAVGGLLYMPASNQKIAQKIITGQYSFVKSMVLDLEDSLGDELVKFGQQNIKSILRQLGDAIAFEHITLSQIPMIFIRVRRPEQIKEAYDLLGQDIKLITGFNIPKFDKSTCRAYVSAFTTVMEKVRQEYGTELYMMPIIESKNAMYRQLRMDNLLAINEAIKPIVNNVLNIRVGGADFCSIFGVRRHIDETIYQIGPVGDCLNDILNMFGRSFVVSAPVWEYFGQNPEDQWAKGLAQEIHADMLNGFLGKTCIHPSQLPFVQKALIVRKTDYLDALSILGMNANTTGVKKSEGGNRMNEVKTHSHWAQKIIGLANVYGVIDDEVEGC